MNKQTELNSLVGELVAMLETIEESDNGREFHPTTRETCRIKHQVRLAKILPRIKKILANTSGQPRLAETKKEV
ncbi:MAG: hypothetical protein WC364_11940 [Eubacteriales bacterium]|jgi:hypothetical protein